MNKVSYFLILFLPLFLLFFCKKDTSRNAGLYEEGMKLFFSNNTAPALHKFEQILQNDPDHLKARLMKGKILFYMRDFERASEDFEKAKKTDPANIDAIFWNGKTLSMMQLKEKEALVELNRVLEKDNSHIEAMYQKAIILERYKKFDEAMNIYQIIIQKKSIIAMAHLHMAKLHRTNGNTENSKKEFEIARQLADDDKALKNEIMLVEMGQK